MFYLVIVPVLFAILNYVGAESVAPAKEPKKIGGDIFPEKSEEKTPLESIPQYHFQYYVSDSDSGDYKTQEESRDGEKVKGSYSVAEANGDLRVVTYVADIKNGFRADVKFHPGGSPMPKPMTKTNRTTNHFRNHNIRSNPFTPSRPRYINTVTPIPMIRSTNIPPSGRGIPPARYESVGNHGNLKTVGIQPHLSAGKQESKHADIKEARTEKDSVVIEMHLNDGTSPDEKSPQVPPKVDEDQKDLATTPRVTVKSNENLSLHDKIKTEPEVTTKAIVEDAMNVPIPTPIEIPKVTEEIKSDGKNISAIESANSSKPEARNVTPVVEKLVHDKIKVEVEQIITDRLHQPTNPAHEEIKKELADRDLKGLQNANIMNNGEGRSNSGSNIESKEELHISVHQNTKLDEAASSRAQKKYSTLPARPLRLVEQVPVGNYQLQTLAEPSSVSMVPNENNHDNGYSGYGTNSNSNGYNYNTNGNSLGYNYNANGNNNFYYDPTLAATVGNFYGNQPGVTHINSNSLKSQMYDQYPAESQPYAIGYEWIKMNPRMVNTNNGESYIIMDPDYSGGKTLFGIPPPTLPHKPTFHNTFFHNWLTKNKPKPHSEPIKHHVDQMPAASTVTVKEPNNSDQKQAPSSPIQNQQVINADNSPKHDQQVPMYYKKEQEKSANPEPVPDGPSKQNLTQKYLESLQAVPFPYQMEVIKVPPPTGVIKQLPVIQPAAINPIPAFTWPTGPVAINPAIAFILLPLQPAQDPPVQPIIVN